MILSWTNNKTQQNQLQYSTTSCAVFFVYSSPVSALRFFFFFSPKFIPWAGICWDCPLAFLSSGPGARLFLFDFDTYIDRANRCVELPLFWVSLKFKKILLRL